MNTTTLSPLGKLQILEVYEFYDRPVLFACRNQSGSLFLAIWVAEHDGEERWLYAPVSRSRLDAVRSGQIDLREAFASTEDGMLFLVRVSEAGLQPEVEVLSEVEDDFLPQPGERLCLNELLPTPEDSTGNAGVPGANCGTLQLGGTSGDARLVSWVRLRPSPSQASAKRAWFDADRLWIELADGRQLSVPLTHFPRLLRANAQQRERFQLSGGGSALHWEELDEDISVQSLLDGYGDRRRTG